MSKPKYTAGLKCDWVDWVILGFLVAVGVAFLFVVASV